MNIYLAVILLIIAGDFILGLVVDSLNMKHLSTTLPEEFEGWYDADRYRKSQDYLRENTRFRLLVDSITTPITVAFILLRRSGSIGGFAAGVLVVIAYYVLNVACEFLVTTLWISPFAGAWLPNVIFTVVTILWFYRVSRQ